MFILHVPHYLLYILCLIWKVSILLLILAYIAFSTLSETSERYPGFPPLIVSPAKQATAKPDLSTFYFFVLSPFNFHIYFMGSYHFIFYILCIYLISAPPSCIWCKTSNGRNAQNKIVTSTFTFFFKTIYFHLLFHNHQLSLVLSHNYQLLLFFHSYQLSHNFFLQNHDFLTLTFTISTFADSKKSFITCLPQLKPTPKSVGVRRR